jgi:hypothetical protein
MINPYNQSITELPHFNCQPFPYKEIYRIQILICRNCTLIGNRSQLSLENKVLLYKAILKPIWTYGIELRGCAKPSSTKILQSFQSKTLRSTTGAPWYVSNKTLHEDLNIPFITDMIKQRANRYRSRLSGHVNQLIADLSKPHANERRLKKWWPEDLIN